jgi:large subunit ribosomal protein L30
MTEENIILIKQIKSLVGSKRNQRLSVKGFGLKKINHIVEVKNTKENLGMINKCKHLIEIIEKNEIK